MTRMILLKVAAGVAVLAGCAEGTAPNALVRDIGILQLQATAAEGAASTDSTVVWDVPPDDGTFTPARTIEVPDTVAVGQPFTITVHTLGMDACWQADGHASATSGRVIEVTPFDRNAGFDRACGEMIVTLAHEGAFSVDEIGEWTIRARGRRVRSDDPGAVTPVVAERVIVAR